MTLKEMERRASILKGGVSMRDIDTLKELLAPTWKPRLSQIDDPIAAGGQYYVDTRPPFNTGALTSVALASTATLLFPVVTFTPTNQSDWFIGKEFRLRINGTITTGATPGNLTVSLAYGTAANTGIISTSAAQTLVANQTTIMFEVDSYFECRGVGTSGGSPSGSMYAWGKAQFGTAVIAVGTFFIPASAPAAANVDTTTNQGISIQMARSGSTAEAIVVQDVIFQAMN